MITQRAMNYAKVLADLSISREDITKVCELFSEVPQVPETLSNPLVTLEEKRKVVEKLFPKEIWNYMRLLCEHNAVGIWWDIKEAYTELTLEKEDKLAATLYYAMKLDNEDIEQVKAMICKKYNKTGVELSLVEDPSLIGGMLLKVKNTEFDKSIKGTLEEMRKVFC